MIAAALEAEVDEYVCAFVDEVDDLPTQCIGELPYPRTGPFQSTDVVLKMGNLFASIDQVFVEPRWLSINGTAVDGEIEVSEHTRGRDQTGDG